uniref:Uncharacterized protein n=1 Tax=Bionectria ochroleuca TaxID=29856 RepID=A0A8H7NA55_BIOOC
MHVQEHENNRSLLELMIMTIQPTPLFLKNETPSIHVFVVSHPRPTLLRIGGTSHWPLLLLQAPYKRPLLPVLHAVAAVTHLNPCIAVQYVCICLSPFQLSLIASMPVPFYLICRVLGLAWNASFLV